jgi:hypothetical protein
VETVDSACNHRTDLRICPVDTQCVAVYGLAGPDGRVHYVGQSVVPAKRFADHVRESFHESKPVSDWIRQVGSANVQLLILERCSWDRRFEREAHWIHHHRTLVDQGGVNLRGPNVTVDTWPGSSRRSPGRPQPRTGPPSDASP